MPTADSELYIADVYTGTLNAVGDTGHPLAARSAKFAPDGRGIYLISDQDGEFAQLRASIRSRRKSAS